MQGLTTLIQLTIVQKMFQQITQDKYQNNNVKANRKAIMIRGWLWKRTAMS